MNALIAWWHRKVLHHQQHQWGIRIPAGVSPLPGERIRCECGGDW